MFRNKPYLLPVAFVGAWSALNFLAQSFVMRMVPIGGHDFGLSALFVMWVVAILLGWGFFVRLSTKDLGFESRAAFYMACAGGPFITFALAILLERFILSLGVIGVLWNPAILMALSLLGFSRDLSKSR